MVYQKCGKEKEKGRSGKTLAVAALTVIAVLMAVVLSSCGMSEVNSEKYIDFVKNCKAKYYSFESTTEETVGEVTEAAGKNTEWSYAKEDGYNYVTFKGTLDYLGNMKNVEIVFCVEESEGNEDYFVVKNLVNGEAVEEDLMTAMYVVNHSEEYIDFVKNSNAKCFGYDGKDGETVAKLTDATCKNIEWSYSKEDGRDYVTLEGTMDYLGTMKNIEVVFCVEESEGNKDYFMVENSVNGEKTDEDLMASMMWASKLNGVLNDYKMSAQN